MDKLEVLRKYFGHQSFREGQELLIDHLLKGDDVLGIMPTGGGKSICYQVPALLLPGITLVISPLISLMIDQVSALNASGVRAAYINSTLTDRQIARALQNAIKGEYKLIYVAPERLHMTAFQQFCSMTPISLVAVDEAHCVSQWGHDFRPSYAHIADFIRSLPTRPHLCAFTATATERVREDIVRLLDLHSPFRLVTGFDRPNLYFEVLEPVDQMAAMLDIIKMNRNVTGIVYCLSRKNVELVCDTLNQHGYSATRYHAGLTEQERKANQEDFKYDRKQIMVATNAFGMGIDKSNVRYVLHYNLPLSLEAYYQEAGRAGRDGLPSQCILLFHPGDIHLGKYLINNSEGNPDYTPQMREQLKALDLERFNDMVSYCFHKRCLRLHILKYFGDKTPCTCTGCVNCSGTHYPQVKEVHRQHKPFGTPAVKPVRRTAIPFASSPAPDESIPTYDLSTLFGRLAATRGELAKRQGLPPYIICSDATLKEMAEKKPGTLPEIADISGMGHAKMRSYGAAFLQVIKQSSTPTPGYENTGHAWTKADLELLRTLNLAGYRVEYIAFRLRRDAEDIQKKMHELDLAEKTAMPELSPATLPANASVQNKPRSWSKKEINFLRMLHDKGWKLHSIARQLGRTDMEVVSQMRNLGITPRYDAPPAEDTTPLSE